MKILFAGLAALLLCSCANQGVVVRKEYNPHEFPLSLGVVASPKLYLRDSTGLITSRLVSYDIFQRYNIGDVFNDEQLTPPLTRPDFKQTEPQMEPIRAINPAPPIMQPSIVPATQHRLAAKKKTSRTLLAAKRRHHHATRAAAELAAR